MSATDDTRKKFVIKHTFDDPRNLKNGETVDGPIEYHYGIPWKVRIVTTGDISNCYLVCPVTSHSTKWAIDAKITGKFWDQIKKILGTETVQYRSERTFHRYLGFSSGVIHLFLIDGKFPVEFHIEITKVKGNFEKKKLRNFDDESAKKHSNVVLKVGDQIFYVNKAYLATHSTYFDALFNGNFAESQKSEIELNDIDPNDFQNFLELIYGELLVDDFSVLGILHLADFFDSKTAIRRCEEFLVQKSKLPLKDKFHAATKYNLEKLKKKCMSARKTPAYFLVPEGPSQFDYSL